MLMRNLPSLMSSPPAASATIRRVLTSGFPGPYWEAVLVISGCAFLRNKKGARFQGCNYYFGCSRINFRSVLSLVGFSILSLTLDVSTNHTNCPEKRSTLGADIKHTHRKQHLPLVWNWGRFAFSLFSNRQRSRNWGFPRVSIFVIIPIVLSTPFVTLVFTAFTRKQLPGPFSAFSMPFRTQVLRKI